MPCLQGNALIQIGIYFPFCIGLSWFLLGVPKNTSNLATYGETGRYPLFVNYITNSVKYYKYLTSKHENSLARKALEVNVNLHDKGQQCWLNHLSKSLKVAKLSLSNDNLTMIHKSLCAVSHREPELWIRISSNSYYELSDHCTSLRSRSI